LLENIAAIDIGTFGIKVVTVKTGFKDFQVKSFAYEDLDPNIENRNEAVKETLSKMIEDYDIMKYRILTNFPMEKSIIRNITFPFNDYEKIAEALPYEAEEHIPFNMNDVVMDFQPIMSKNPDEGRILLAASHKDAIYEYLKSFKDLNLQPIMLGLESNALFECYKYLNKIEDETIIQLYIGHDKTIINFIKNNKLLYTRSILIGVRSIIKSISEIMDVSYSSSLQLFNQLNLDLTSLDNNLQRDSYKNLDINKLKLIEIYENALEIVKDLISQIVFTNKALSIDFKDLEFNRILICGGGSNIRGIGTVISKELDLPVVALPFLPEYKEQKIQTQFQVAFGIILTYLNKKQSAINLLKGEFLPNIISSPRKIYYLSGAFIGLAIIFLIINIIATFIMKSQTNEMYAELLNKNFKKYFHNKTITGDPISEAMKLLKSEKKELENLESFLHKNESILDMFSNILSFFPQEEESFELKNLVINEKIIRMDGTVGTSKYIDDFKNKLLESKRYDTVSLNTNISKKNKVRFSMTIKLKLSQKDADAKKRGKKK